MQITGDKSGLNVKSVVYATDFTIGAQNAGLYASGIAAYLSATLVVAHAFTLSQAALEVESGQTLVSQERKDLRLLLSDKIAQLGGKAIKTASTLLEGAPKKVIPELADKHSPSIIVLGTHGGGRFEREIIGSTAEEILRSTRWPSLTVGPRVPTASAKTLPFKRILFATELASAAGRAASYAVTFAEAFRAGIDVLNVIPENVIGDPDRVSVLQSHFYEALKELVPQQAKQLCDPKTFVEAGDAHDRILQHIKERSIDLLVLGVRKSSHLSLEMRTSRAFQVIVDAECPVLTIRQSALDQ